MRRIATAPRSNAADVERAVAVARAAFLEWRAVPAPLRGEVLLRAGRALEARKEALARTMAAEMGKRLEEARGDVQEAIERIDAGITYVNAPTIGAEAHFPFGGVKATGNGHREGGWAPYDFFTEVKTVYVDYSGGLQRAQIDNREDVPPRG